MGVDFRSRWRRADCFFKFYLAVSIAIDTEHAHKRVSHNYGAKGQSRLLLKPGTGRDKRGISRPVPPTKTRDGIEFYCKRIRRRQRKGSRLLERGTELLGVTTSVKNDKCAVVV